MGVIIERHDGIETIEAQGGLAPAVYASCERDILDIVNKAFGTDYDLAGLYRGATRVAYTYSTTRYLVYYVLHNFYGEKYAAIARRAQKTVPGVMRGIMRLQSALDADRRVVEAFRAVMDRLYNGGFAVDGDTKGGGDEQRA